MLSWSRGCALVPSCVQPEQHRRLAHVLAHLLGWLQAAGDSPGRHIHQPSLVVRDWRSNSGSLRWRCFANAHLCSTLHASSVMEVFTFVQMGGDATRITTLPFGADKKEEQANFDRLRDLDVGKSECFKIEDKERLFAVIEASYGTTSAFNKAARRVLVGRRPLQSLTESIDTTLSA